MKVKFNMKKIILFVFCSLLVACGNVSQNNELVGQPKRLHNVTPILCPNRVDLDISMGFVKDGVGSMSTQDLFLTVPNQADVDLLKKAIEDRRLIKIHYNEARFTICSHEEYVTQVEIL